MPDSSSMRLSRVARSELKIFERYALLMKRVVDEYRFRSFDFAQDTINAGGLLEHITKKESI